MQREASAEILRAIANASGDIAGPLQLIAATTARLFKASSVAIQLAEGSDFTQEYRVGAIAKRVGSAYPRSTIKVGGRNLPGTVVAECRQIHIPNLDRLDPAMADFPGLPHARAGGARTVCGTPLRHQRNAIGAIIVFRDRLMPFTAPELDLLQTFADQAVIAIENARLFNETREALRRQTATADILRIISRSVAQAAPVFDTILQSCQRLFNPYDAAVYLVEGDRVRGVAQRGAAAGDWGADTMPLEGSMTGLALAQRQPVHFPDIAEKPDFPEDKRAVVEQRGGMTVLYSPIISESRGVGSLVLTRQPKKPFTDSEIEFIQGFADQAAIAIENARLFDEVQERTRELSQSLDDLRTAQDRLVQTEKLASLGQLTAGIAHEIKNPLNFVNNFSALSVDLVDEMADLFENAALDESVRRKELDEIRELLKSNLEKIVQHGKRADAIVKNMLLHSREGSGEQRAVDINALLEESLNLAYHGARAEKPGFNITLQRDLDPAAGTIEVFPQDITRALLNLISNGFYAASQRKATNAEQDFEPVLGVVTRNLARHVEIRIRDNGTGIPPEVREKVFNPFFTTKPPGEGTGLGLSMTHDIIVKQHGGRIELDTQPGQFTEFSIVLPRTSAQTHKPKA